jgi:thiol-disulfide isomerase/thioredoxin
MAQLVHGAQAGQIVPINENHLGPLLEHFKGKVVLVNLWATWCIACQEEFPVLVNLHQKYHDKGMEVIAISFDQIDRRESQVEPFLRTYQVQFPTFIKQTKNDKAFVAAISNDFVGVLPTTLIFDRTGELVAAFEGERDFKIFAGTIEPLLK